MEEKKVYWTAEVAAEVGVSTTTINRWTHALEGLGYTILAGTEGRAYTKEDIEIFKRMKEESRNGPKTKNTDLARKILGLGHNEKYERKKSQEVSNNESNEKQIEDERLKEITSFIRSYQQTISELNQKIMSLENRVETENLLMIREEQMALWTLEHHVESELRKEAEKAWADLPSSEREHRVFVGIFPKRVENLEKKKNFISDYIRERKHDEVIKRWTERQELLKQKLERQKLLREHDNEEIVMMSDSES